MLDSLLKKSWMPFLIRIGSLLFFILLMYLLFIGTLEIFSIKLTSKIALFLIWTLWWPVLYLTLFFVGRFWCGFICPISLANEAGNYLRKGKALNLLKWSPVPFIIFFLVVYFEQISGLFSSANITLAFITSFFLIAFIFGILFSRFAFCLFICPIGTLLRVFSRLSISSVRSNLEICKDCKTFECMKGAKADKCPVFVNIPINKSNSVCLDCTNCIKNCPYDSAKWKFVKPGKEVIDKVGFNKAESFFIIALLAFTTILTTNGNLLYRKLLPFELTGSLLRLADFSIAILIFWGLYLGITYLTTIISKEKYKNAIKEYGYVYLPLVFFIMFYTIIFDFLGPYLKFTELTISLTKYTFLFLGIIWSILILFSFIKKFKKTAGLFHLLFIIILGLFWVIYLIPGPLNLYPELSKTIIVTPGMKVTIDAYSMGFDPNTLIVKKGEQVVIELTNKDVTHAFDIAEFNVHKIINGGKTTTIKFTPDKLGEFKLYCSIPGHEEAGMKGKIIVKS